jgi:hypothetical protein
VTLGDTPAFCRRINAWPFSANVARVSTSIASTAFDAIFELA